MRLQVALLVLLCNCASEQSLPSLDRLKGLTKPELEQRLGKPDASPSSDHLVYLVKGNFQSAPGLPNGCALHITLKEGVVADATGVESDLLCRDLMKSKGF